MLALKFFGLFLFILLAFLYNNTFLVCRLCLLKLVLLGHNKLQEDEDFLDRCQSFVLSLQDPPFHLVHQIFLFLICFFVAEKLK